MTLRTCASTEISIEYLSLIGILKSRARMPAAMVAILGEQPSSSRKRRTMVELRGESAQMRAASPS